MASKALTVESNKVDNTDDISDRQAAAAFGARLRERAREININRADLGRLAGIKKQSMSGYWEGKNLPGSERLFPLSDALRVRARWLVSGAGPRLAENDLLDASEAEWVRLPRYDLRNLTETSKGLPLEHIPYRRDWLNRRLFTASGLWITELPSDYESLGLAEGDAVICSDVVRGDRIEEGWMCIFRSATGLFVAKYHDRPNAAANEPAITGIEMVDAEIDPIARIRARMLTKL